MPFVYADRVKEQSTSTGLGPMVVTGALPGFQDFATGVGDGNQSYYTIFNGADNDWEVGIGTFSTGALTRDTVISSANSNNPVVFQAGTKTVFATVASQFFSLALDSVVHSTLNHTGIPGVPAPETFTSGDHSLVDHTTIPFSLLDLAAHEAVDHKLAPLSLLDEPAHDVLDHSGVNGVNNFDSIAHALINHFGLPGVPPAETFTNPVHAATDHAGLPGVEAATPLQVATFAPSTFSWLASSAGISTGGLAFTPTVAFAFAAFHHTNNTTAAGVFASFSAGVATSSNEYSTGLNVESAGDGNDMGATHAIGSIAGFSGESNFPLNLRSAWQLASVNVTWSGMAGITLTPSTTITGNLTLIVLGS